MNRMRFHRTDTMLSGDRPVVTRWTDKQNEKKNREERRVGLREGVRYEYVPTSSYTKGSRAAWISGVYFAAIIFRCRFPVPFHQSRTENAITRHPRTHHPQHVHTQ